ncbi:hypothetical protein HF563_09465 [Acidithiobacillus ferridurans]|nr:hypothetical protein [Acidithiobacillus ferridurans]
MRLHSYVVRYDSGFAPNPFYGRCTLATCKPGIRRSAAIGDWVVGSGSNDHSVRRGGHLVYAMRVTETLSFRDYDTDQRFDQKKPYRYGSRKQSCGDNIYYRNASNNGWNQRDSFHTKPDGTPNPEHITRDTGVDRVLVSEDFVYFGGYGPRFPNELRNFEGLDICKSGIGRTCFEHSELVDLFVRWIRSLGVSGYQSAPFEWRTLRG